MLKLQEEVSCIHEAAGSVFDNFDPIIDAFEDTGIERILGQDEYAS